MISEALKPQLAKAKSRDHHDLPLLVVPTFVLAFQSGWTVYAHVAVWMVFLTGVLSGRIFSFVRTPIRSCSLSRVITSSSILLVRSVFLPIALYLDGLPNAQWLILTFKTSVPLNRCHSITVSTFSRIGLPNAPWLIFTLIKLKHQLFFINVTDTVSALIRTGFTRLERYRYKNATSLPS